MVEIKRKEWKESFQSIRNPSNQQVSRLYKYNVNVYNTFYYLFIISVQRKTDTFMTFMHKKIPQL